MKFFKLIRIVFILFYCNCDNFSFNQQVIGTAMANESYGNAVMWRLQISTVQKEYIVDGSVNLNL